MSFKCGTHPCAAQKVHCTKGDACFFRGLPNDSCIHFIKGNCNFGANCNKSHVEQYRQAFLREKAKRQAAKPKPSPPSMGTSTKIGWSSTTASIKKGRCPCEAQYGSCTYGDKCRFAGCPADLCVRYLQKGEGAGGCDRSRCELSHPKELKAELDKARQAAYDARAKIAEFARKCPKCLSVIEKGHGCNHMHCAKCNQDFDWQNMEGTVNTNSRSGLDLAVLETNAIQGWLLEKEMSSQIFVKASNRTLKFSFSANNSTVDDLIAFVAQREGICSDEVRLLFGAKQLQSGRYLHEYNIQVGSTMHLVFRLPGGF